MSKYVIFNLEKSDDICRYISDNLNIEYSNNIDKEQFKNGEINVTFTESIRNKTVILASRTNNYTDIFRLFVAADAARRADCSKVYAIIPYLPHSRQERRDKKRTSITSRLFADLLETSGYDKIITVDLHTTAIEGNYSNRTTIENMLPTEVFTDVIKGFNFKAPKLISPDMGYSKKIKEYDKILNYGIVICDKERSKANEVDDIKVIGDVKGFDCIIIDDIIDTGGTLIKVSETLFENGANTVTVLGTHGIFSDNAVDKLKNSRINSVYISNTISNDRTEGINLIDINSVYVDLLKRVFN